MVAVQVLLMNYFLLGLHTDHQISNDVLLPDVGVGAGGECSYGCTQCSPVNGCLACKPPYFLYLHRDGSRQTAVCMRSCPVGFYKLKRKNKRGFCAKCILRGCRECSTRHYCSVCKPGLVRDGGRCRKRCPVGTRLSTRYPGLCLAAPVSIPDAPPNEIEVNGTIASRRPPPPRRRPPGPRKPSGGTTRRPRLYPGRVPHSTTMPPPQNGLPGGTPDYPTDPQYPLKRPDDPSVTQLEEPHLDGSTDPQLLYPELTTNRTTSSASTPEQRRRKKRKRKKKRRKKDKRRHEKNRRRKSRERRRRKRLRNKERRKKKEKKREDLITTISPMIPSGS